MRKQFAILAAMALLSVPLTASSETTPSDDHLQPGMTDSDRMDATEEAVDNGEIVKAEIVEIEGNRLVAEIENGEQLVFLIEGSADTLGVGDELEMIVNDEAKTAVILNVLPQHEGRNL